MVMIKRLQKKLLYRLIVLTVLFTLGATSYAFASVGGTVTDNGVNIRNKANTSGDIVMTASSGQPVTVFLEEGDFYKVSFANKENVFIAKQFVKINQPYGVVSAVDVNVRKTPSTSAPVLGKVSNGHFLGVDAADGDWYIITYYGTQGYIHRDFLTGNTLVNVQKAPPQALEATVEPASAPAPVVENFTQAGDSTYAVVNVAGLNLRKEASTDAPIITTLSRNEAVDVSAVGSSWVQVSVGDSVGFLNTDYITVGQGEKPEKPVANTAIGAEVVAYATQFLGTPYVYGGTNLKSGVDCSGFVYAVMANFNVKLGRSSRDMSSNGYAISKGELQIGDLVFFAANGSTISHVAIFVSDGKYIHSTDAKGRGISYSNLNDDYSARTFHSARRVL